MKTPTTIRHLPPGRTLALTLAFALAAVATTTALATEISTLTTKISGRGRPMILIPGLACPGEVWDATVSHFQDRYECHVVSLAGFGGVPARATEAPFLPAAREELAAYIRDHRMDRPVMVGHSLGGFIVLDLAARHPELPGELVLIDSLPFVMGIMRPGATAEDGKQVATAAASAFSQMNAEAYAAMIRGGPNGGTMAAAESDVERIIGWGLASDPATVTRAITEMYSTDLRPMLGRIASPTLALAAWVGYAPYSSHEFVEKTYRVQYAARAGFRLELTDTARHFIMFDEPQWTFGHIERFLASAPR